MNTKLVAIAFFGAMGVLTRYGIDYFLGSKHSWPPIGTIIANLIGCLLAGFLFHYFQQKNSALMASALVVGFCGGLTTFSSYCVQAVDLINRQMPLQALAYLSLLPILGGIAVFLGIKLSIIVLR